MAIVLLSLIDEWYKERKREWQGEIANQEERF